MPENIIKKKSFQFALDIILINRILTAKKEFVISNQLLRSATNVGANAEEADAAQTKRDFVTKMSIASKEAREANYWLRLIKFSKILDHSIDDLISKSEELKRILTSIVNIPKIHQVTHRHLTFNIHHLTLNPRLPSVFIISLP